MKLTRSHIIYASLTLAWIVVGIWQVLEHNRAKTAAREALRNRARGISYSLAAVVRSQEFFGRIRQARIEAALRSLAKSQELISLALLNASGDVVALAGEPIRIDKTELARRGEWWEKDSVRFVNLIDLGSEIESGEPDGQHPRIIVSPDEPEGPGGPGGPIGPGGRRGGPGGIGGPGGGPPPQPLRYNIVRTSESVILRLEYPPDFPTTGPRFGGERPVEPPGLMRPRPQKVISQRTSEALVLEIQYSPDQPTSPLLAMVGPDRDWREGGFRRGGRRPPPFGRPPWMNEAEFQEILQQQGLHGFVLKMSTDAVRAETARDRWLRFVVMSVVLVAVVGVGLAWRAFENSAQLQIRLTRASEMNAYLREMNIAAAGLAHETRNPLNIVRGLAQMINNMPDAPPEIRKRSSDIAEEVDRVTARLNEFIDYSKPREAKPAPTNLTAIIRDVERTLESDITDKAVAFTVEGPDLTVEADESLLRQVLFNLLMNAIQAVSHGGKVAAFIERKSAQEAVLEIRDNGPGIPAEAVKNLFRPYFTMHERGTGLGLAIVRQIVLAHGWDIQYLPNEPQGARFRISGMRISARAPLS